MAQSGARFVPVNWLIDERPVLVVGGGRVGLRKINSLLAAGASVRLVCPDAVEELSHLSSDGRIEWIKRPFDEEDVGGAALVFACTDDRRVNRKVLEASRNARVPCSLADGSWRNGDFTASAVCRTDDGVTVSVSTGGQSCRRAKEVRDGIAEFLEREEAPCELYVVPMNPDVAAADWIGSYLAENKFVDEFAVVSTCNRLEVVALARKPGFMDALNGACGGRLLRGASAVTTGTGAFKRLVRVASGMDSPILGEYHVVHQMKEAVDGALAKGSMSGRLRGIFDSVFAGEKAVRNAVAPLMKVREIENVAVGYLETSYGDEWPNVRCLVIGTGVVGSGAIGELLKSGVKNVTWIYHRNAPDKRDGVTIVGFDELERCIAVADCIVCAAKVMEPIVKAPMFADGKRRTVVDLGAPSNAEREVGEVAGVRLVDMDELKDWYRSKTGRLDEIGRVTDSVIDGYCKGVRL